MPGPKQPDVSVRVGRDVRGFAGVNTEQDAASIGLEQFQTLTNVRWRGGRLINRSGLTKVNSGGAMTGKVLAMAGDAAYAARKSGGSGGDSGPSQGGSALYGLENSYIYRYTPADNESVQEHAVVGSTHMIGLPVAFGSPMPQYPDALLIAYGDFVGGTEFARLYWYRVNSGVAATPYGPIAGYASSGSPNPLTQSRQLVHADDGLIYWACNMNGNAATLYSIDGPVSIAAKVAASTHGQGRVIEKQYEETSILGGNVACGIGEVLFIFQNGAAGFSEGAAWRPRIYQKATSGTWTLRAIPAATYTRVYVASNMPVVPSTGSVGATGLPWATYGSKIYFAAQGLDVGAPNRGDALIYSWDGSTLTLERTIAGSDADPYYITCLRSFNGYLYYAYSRLTAATCTLGRYDGSTWTDAHKDMSTAFTGCVSVYDLVEFRGELYAALSQGAGTAAGFVTLASTTNQDTGGTWNSLSVYGSSATGAGVFRGRTLVVR